MSFRGWSKYVRILHNHVGSTFMKNEGKSRKGAAGTASLSLASVNVSQSELLARFLIHCFVAKLKTFSLGFHLGLKE